jgi:ABC-2 type transport system permease protein
MRHVLTLFRRELAGYFLGPMAFLILLAFQMIAWFNFAALVEDLSRNSLAFSGLRDPMNAYISGSPAFWIGLFVAIPALTMRLIAEERRSGTLEPLLTSPVTETEVVIAKWLAGVVMYLTLLIPFFLYLPFLYYQAKYHFDLGPLMALAIGLSTMGMMFVAMGLFFSSLTRNQIIAAVLTFVSVFLLIVVTQLTYNSAMERRQVALAEAVQFVSLVHQVSTLATGQLDLRYLALHLSACVLMLYLTVKVLEYRRES